MGNAVSKKCAEFIHRIRRIRNQRHITGIDKRQKYVGDAFLGTNERHHFRRRIQGYVKPFFIPGCSRRAKLQRSFVIGIAMILRLADRFAHFVDDLRRRRLVRISDAETNNIHAFSDRFPFLFVNQRK